LLATFVLVFLLAEASPLEDPPLLADGPPLFDALRLPDFLDAVLLAPRLAPFDALLRLEDLDAVFFDAAFLGAAFFDAVFEDVFDAALEEPPLDDLEAALEPPLELLEAPPEDLLPAFLAGTFSPRSLASESPIAMACLREVTFLPLRPLFNFPSCISCIVFSTLLPAPFEYLAIIFDLKGLVSILLFTIIFVPR
jgi:hypothetical protein